MAGRKLVLRVVDAIPLSNLAHYGNFEYDLGNERIFSLEDLCHDFSVMHEADDVETWLLNAVEEECYRLVSARLLEPTKTFPSYLSDVCKISVCSSRDDDFELSILPVDIDEVADNKDCSTADDNHDKWTSYSGLRCCTENACCNDSISSSVCKESIWVEQCKWCADKSLQSCRTVSNAAHYKAQQKSKVVQKSGAYFPVEWKLPHQVDPDEMSDALLTCIWMAGINENRDYSDDEKSSSQTPSFISDDDPFIPFPDLSEILGTPIPVHMKSQSTYSPLARECGKGVNFHNLILLSPQCLRNRGEKAWWRCYGGVNKLATSAEQLGVEITEESRNNKTGASRRLYSDVLTTSPVSQTKSDAKSTEQSLNISHGNTEIFYFDSINRFLQDFPALSPL